MTAAKLDPSVARELAANLEREANHKRMPFPELCIDAAALLTAAADLAEEHTELQRERDWLSKSRDADHAAHKENTLTEERVREVVQASFCEVEHLCGHPDAWRVANRAAKELAGAVVATLSAADINAIVGAAAMEELPDLTNRACMRVADRATAKLAGAVVGLSAEERNEMLSCRGFAALRGYDLALALIDRLLATPLSSAGDRVRGVITGQSAAALTERLKPAISPSDAAIIDDALAHYAHSGPDAPTSDIVRIRAELTAGKDGAQ